jgi:SOS response regulatory protein OraA/RecX
MKVRDNLAGFLIVLALTVLFAIVGCGPKTDVPTYTPYTPAAPATEQVQATTQPAKPAGTVSQQQAVAKANDYLEYQAFSKKGLVGQLKYEGFSDADAKYAVENITVDWMEQAAKKADSYLSHQAFSRTGLIGQLKYEGFTTEEATHGAESVGLK